MTTQPIPPVLEAELHKRIQYSLTRWDIFRWNIYVLARSRFLIGFGLLSSAGLIWNDLHSPDLAGKSAGFKIFYAIFLTMALFGVVGVGMMIMMLSLVFFKKHRGLLCRHELEIRDDGLLERTEVNESLHRWPGFHKIATTGNYLYIYVTDNNVHVVPRRAFPSDADLIAFRAELERHMKAAAAIPT
jgi:YcxB-like protein